MSEANVEAVKRAMDAYNRRDLESLLETLDTEIEWRPALQTLFQGEATVYRGHAGIREFFRDQDEVLDEVHVEYSEVRDLGDRVVAIGIIRTRGKGSGVETESPLGAVSDHKNGKVIRVRTYLDPEEAVRVGDLPE